MSDILDEISDAASKQWRTLSLDDQIKQELARRYDTPAWMEATMGSCQLSTGEEIHLALIATSPRDTDMVHAQFIVVEWNGERWFIHETINNVPGKPND